MESCEEAGGALILCFEMALALSQLQGSYFVATGLWPLAHMKSFEKVTGKKTDKWLVKTVGAVVAVVGVALLSAGIKKRITPELKFLGAGAAAALAAVDLFYVGQRRIPPIYLLDALPEIALVAGWMAGKK